VLTAVLGTTTLEAQQHGALAFAAGLAAAGLAAALAGVGVGFLGPVATGWATAAALIVLIQAERERERL
jgi:hypothetical protein